MFRTAARGARRIGVFTRQFPLMAGMPIQRDEADDLRPLAFREPEAVLDEDKLYTVYEIGRLLQGLDPDVELDVETENVLLDWAIPWMMNHADEFVFAEPADDTDPGYYGLAR
jgi:hypothetical protein